MTRKQAISILEQRKCCRECVADCTCKECDDAFDMAIKAIENEEKLLKENRALKNRCKASTQGLLCSFCPLECEQRAEDYKAESEG